MKLLQLCGICFLLVQFAQSRLIFLTTLSRHGDRSPVSTFPNDPFLSHWTHGLGQLTMKGAQQHARLGAFIRHRYSDFLSPSYHKDEAYFRSSASPRVLMSAYNFVRSLYRLDDDQVTSSGQLIPYVMNLDHQTDNLLHMTNPCPTYSAILNRELAKGWVTSDAYVHMYSLFSSLYPDHFPSNMPRYALAKRAWNMCDSLLIWFDHHLDGLPEWASSDVQASCIALFESFFSQAYMPPDLSSFRGLPLARHLMGLLQARRRVDQSFNYHLDHRLYLNITSRSQLVAYFGHDSTLSALMRSLGIFNNRIPPLASCLIIELHRKSDHQYYLRFVYRNQTQPDDAPVYPLWPDACDGIDPLDADYLCPLDRLAELVTKTEIGDCKATDVPSNDDHTSVNSQFICPPLFSAILIIQSCLLAWLVLRGFNWTAIGFIRFPWSLRASRFTTES